MKYTAPLFLALIASPAIAQESREMDAHEHGVGELNIAVQGNTVAMEFHAPGADIVGFEYVAKSAEDRAAINAAVAVLSKPLDLFVMPDAAECSVTQASAALESDADHGDHDDHAHEEHAESDAHHDHDDHDHDEHAEAEGHDGHDHDEHAEAEGHDGHDHDEHAEAEASHSEFHAEYELNCGNPGALSDIQFAYFDQFENARELRVQIVTATGAQAFDVDADDPTLDLKGMF